MLGLGVRLVDVGCPRCGHGSSRKGWRGGTVAGAAGARASLGEDSPGCSQDPDRSVSQLQEFPVLGLLGTLGYDWVNGVPTERGRWIWAPGGWVRGGGAGTSHVEAEDQVAVLLPRFASRGGGC